MAKKTLSESQRLRRFGWVMAVALGLLAGYFAWHERPAATYLGATAGAFLVVGTLLPRALWPLERVWMGLARVLQTVVTTVILTLTFFVVMTPLGIGLRLGGKDLLGMKPDPEQESYWVPAEPDGPGTRPDKPY